MTGSPNGRTLRRGVAVAAAVAGLALLAHRQGAESGRSDGDRARGQSPVVGYPGPGWRFASPRTTISFRGAAVDALAGLSVSGDRSGAHAGRLRAHRAGAVFMPDSPFRAGETVTVRAPVPVRGAEDGTFSFRTARFSGTGFARAAAGAPPAAPAPDGGSGLRPPCRTRTLRFRTVRSGPRVDMCSTRTAARRLSPGKLLLTPRSVPGSSPKHWVAVILSRSGRPLWYAPQPSRINDMKVVRLDGRRLLALFRERSQEEAFYELLDERYRRVTRILAGNGYVADGHELQLTRTGTAYVGAYQTVLDAAGRKVVDYVVQEIDVATGDVLFEWHALDHVPPSASHRLRRAADVPHDYFHGNSIEPPRRGRGTILISARNTSAVYAVDSVTGAVRWTLGGRDDDFGLAGRKRFCAQHDARRLPNGDVTVFDNGGTRLRTPRRCPLHPARALQFRLDTRRMRARLIRSVSSRRSSEDGRGYFPRALGSARRQPNGNVVVNWGSVPRITEVTRTGRPLFRLALSAAGDETGNRTYRAVRARWTGRPSGRPAVAARRAARGAVHVWASWNGATEIRRWRVLAGDRRDGVRRTEGTFRFSGLETRMRLRGRVRYVAVQALDSRGTPLGRSRAVRVR